MKVFRSFAIILLLLSMGLAIWNWKEASELRAANSRLREELEETKRQSVAATTERTKGRDAELARLRAGLEELPRLRNEISQLRVAARQSVQLTNRPAPPAATTANLPSPLPAVPSPAPAGGQFPREAWTFAGYATPETALVSALWSMKEGNPRAYLETLAPTEQIRMAQAWADKSEVEIAAKHQRDVSKITSMTVLDKQIVSDDEVVMNVQIEGIGRTEKVSMKRVDSEWKFGGFIPNPPPPPTSAQPAQ